MTFITQEIPAFVLPQSDFQTTCFFVKFCYSQNNHHFRFGAQYHFRLPQRCLFLRLTQASFLFTLPVNLLFLLHYFLSHKLASPQFRDRPQKNQSWKILDQTRHINGTRYDNLFQFFLPNPEMQKNNRKMIHRSYCLALLELDCKQFLCG